MGLFLGSPLYSIYLCVYLYASTILLWLLKLCNIVGNVVHVLGVPSSVQLLSRVRLCDPMNCSTPGHPVHHQLPEFTQIHVHRVGDASSVVPFSSCLQSLPASGSFPVSQLFTWGGQSIGVSASVLPVNTQDWSPLGWTGWISLLSKGLLVGR